jgi:uncharacterized membrane protein YoaK (UPF0700 family)
MDTFIGEVRQTLLPARGAKHGVMPPLLIGMTVVTGLVDAFSYLTLGHVFVANMTGNVVFLAFALVGVNGFSVVTALVALAAFALGALGGGFFGSRLAGRPWTLLGGAAALEAFFIAAALLLSLLFSTSTSDPQRYALTAVLAIAMGLQNAAVRTLAVPDLTTTVLTRTITGIAADARLAGGNGSKSGRRLIAIISMLGGALVGAALILHDHVAYPLAIAFVIAAAIAVASRVPWTSAVPHGR